MKPVVTLVTLMLVALATAAWGHPGHGAQGETHHLVDLLALAGIVAVFGFAWSARKGGGKDHD